MHVGILLFNKTYVLLYCGMVAAIPIRQQKIAARLRASGGCGFPRVNGSLLIKFPALSISQAPEM